MQARLTLAIVCSLVVAIGRPAAAQVKVPVPPIGGPLVSAAKPPVPRICDCNGSYEYNRDSRFDGGCSIHTDAARRIVKYEWNFKYDAALGFKSDAQGVTAVKVGGYPAGLHPVALRVTDDTPGKPQVAVASCSVVAKPRPNCPHPSAGGPGRQYFGIAGVPLTLDASGSWDPEGDPMTFLWRLDGATTLQASGVKVQAVYNAPGSYAVEVAVTDAPGSNAAPYQGAACTVRDFAVATIRPSPSAPTGVKTGG